MSNISFSSHDQSRVLSIDFFRGFTMFMLIGEFSGFFGSMVDTSMDGTIISAIGRQFHHVDWVGLHFWDLIQPFFMFIVGVGGNDSRVNRGNWGWWGDRGTGRVKPGRGGGSDRRMVGWWWCGLTRVIREGSRGRVIFWECGGSSHIGGGKWLL